MESRFGKMQVMVTDGHLPYPFGREIMGYEVKSLPATLTKARESGAKVLTPPFETVGRSTAMLAFPGDYIAEVHAMK
jgi:predicted enzyme related to lactoylglutathione lyase